jgi:hypothetical protein
LTQDVFGDAWLAPVVRDKQAQQRSEVDDLDVGRSVRAEIRDQGLEVPEAIDE